jgi:hypothetical protein
MYSKAFLQKERKRKQQKGHRQEEKRKQMQRSSERVRKGRANAQVNA